MLRTSVSAAELVAPDVVRTYKRLAKLERTFRRMKSFDVEIRPLHHYTAKRVRAHIFLCLLAAHLQWHLEEKWAPLLFKDEHPPRGDDPVAAAQRSPEAVRKARRQQLDDGSPVHSFRTLLQEMATITRDRLLPTDAPAEAAFDLVTTPSPKQVEALRLLGLNPNRL